MLEDLQTNNGEQADRAEDWLFSIDDEIPSLPTRACNEYVWKCSLCSGDIVPSANSSNGSSSFRLCNFCNVFFGNSDFVADSMSSQGDSSSCQQERSMTSIGDVLKLFGNPDSELLVESFSPRSDCNDHYQDEVFLQTLGQTVRELNTSSNMQKLGQEVYIENGFIKFGRRRHHSRQVPDNLCNSDSSSTSIRTSKPSKVLQKQIQKLKELFEERKLTLPKKEPVVKPPSTEERTDFSHEHPGIPCKGTKPCANVLARGTCRFREDCQFCHLHERRSSLSNPSQSARLRARKKELKNYLKEQEELLQVKILDD